MTKIEAPSAHTQMDEIRADVIDALANRPECGNGMTCSCKCCQLFRRVIVDGDFSGLIMTSMGTFTGKGYFPNDPYRPATVARMENGVMIGERPGSGGNGKSSPRAAKMATSKQINYIRALLDKVSDPVRNQAEPWINGHFDEHGNNVSMTCNGASKIIDRLRHYAYGTAMADGNDTATKPEPTPVVTARPDPSPWTEWRAIATPLCNPARPEHGYRYATTNDDGTTGFWKISVWENPTNGRRFVNLYQIIGGQGAVRYSGNVKAMITIARKIAEDPKAAMIRFGREIGSCAHCGRTLTDEESRERGIGPVCARKVG